MRPLTLRYSLDLPPTLAKHTVGEEFRGCPEESKITKLVGDSRTFDYSPWNDTCDFVWVDACHDYAFVE